MVGDTNTWSVGSSGYMNGPGFDYGSGLVAFLTTGRLRLVDSLTGALRAELTGIMDYNEPVTPAGDHAGHFFFVGGLDHSDQMQLVAVNTP